MNATYERRPKILRIPFGDLCNILLAMASGRWVTIDGIPEDTTITACNATVEPTRRNHYMSFVIENDTFDPVPRGGNHTLFSTRSRSLTGPKSTRWRRP